MKTPARPILRAAMNCASLSPPRARRSRAVLGVLSALSGEKQGAACARSHHGENRLLWPAAALLLAFGLRLVGLNQVPPGWRDDEVIETTVHAQRVLQGDWPLYFVEAEGHEPLYHYVSAGWIALFGNALPTVRMVSAFFGLLSIAATHRLARQLFGRDTAMLATLLLAVSFWSLMYSRTKTRHVSELVFVLLAFSAWWQGVRQRRSGPLLTSGIFLGLSLYTYFAALAGPAILAGASLYALLVERTPFREWRRTALIPIGLAGAMYLPLFLAARASGAERLFVVGAPLRALRAGDAGPAIETAQQTLGMFAWSGDPEALYNLPGRPVLGVPGFLALLAGVLLAAARWRSARHGFLLLWLGVGLAPAFLSLPAASLGHTITAQPAVYLLAALPVTEAARWLRKAGSPGARGALLGLSALLLAAVGARDLRDYFVVWPREGQVRFLYRADLHTQAGRWREHPPQRPLAISGTLSVWDDRALGLELGDQPLARRWFRSEYAFVYPQGELPVVFDMFPSAPNSPSTLLTEQARRAVLAPAQSLTAAYPLGFALQGYTTTHTDGSVLVHLFWRVLPAYVAPELVIGTSPQSPPQPLQAFVHLLDGDGKLVAGADHFDVDAYTLQPGDEWVQLHQVLVPDDLPTGDYVLTAGLYNPATGARLRTDTGLDEVVLGNIRLPIAGP